MEHLHAYKIDLTKIDGNGDFFCPRCMSTISPEDNTEEAYSLLEPKVISNDLEELLIRCNICASHILLTGFSLLQKVEMTEDTSDINREATVFVH